MQQPPDRIFGWASALWGLYTATLQRQGLPGQEGKVLDKLCSQYLLPNLNLVGLSNQQETGFSSGAETAILFFHQLIHDCSMHLVSEPSILYFGTPVVLISTINENGSYNLAPISSVFWLGWRSLIGISALSKTTENLLRTKQCVLNLPSVNEVDAVNRLALTTGSNPIPKGKLAKGYRFEPAKFEAAGLTPAPSGIVEPPRVAECPVQMEAQLMSVHPVAEDNNLQRGRIVSLELKIVRVHLEESILMNGFPNKVDPDKWRPLIMSFQQFYGLGEQVHPSALAKIPEQLYQTPDIETARSLTNLSEI